MNKLQNADVTLGGNTFTVNTKTSTTSISKEMQEIIDRQNGLTQKPMSKEPLKSVADTDLEEAEILPLYTNLLVRPYKSNPYAQMEISENGIVTKTDTPSKKKNPNTGEMESPEEFIIVARVEEVGPDVTYVKAGDDVFYTKPSSTPVPFLKLGMYVIPEQRVLAVVNSKLKERWNK